MIGRGIYALGGSREADERTGSTRKESRFLFMPLSVSWPVSVE
jgi:ABC-type xylose transport system permease subunit